ncbi:MAG: Na/Pi cotransporter family protein [Xanthomonadaceae bacterium]|nr:Na/Pi cotransporter family protein [Xanthomonadaceae bacterium]MCA0197323.1 Na/Pi symporter [Pseudomonadota bacterium]HRF84304.1 Na/Pi symporter [Pseudoxanthomonas sp.]
MTLDKLRLPLFVLLAAVLGWSFWRNDGWLLLCAGLAIFLFGMQCLEEGLRQLAGGSLEKLLARSTGTPARGLAFGIVGTTLLQSSTLVSLLAIAFLGSGLIQLAGGIAIILGANLGATTGIWLLALAGQNVSLAPAALPMLVFGVLGSFAGPRGKAAGRVLLGIAFIFLGIDGLRAGFEAMGGSTGFDANGTTGVAQTLLFVLIGLVATVVLQSTHAVLMLALAALAGGQLQLDQSLAIAIGSNVGSSVSTAVVGMFGSNRSGQRLALFHVLFNVTTAVLALLLLTPLTWTMKTLAGWGGFGDNALLQLALFHTLFNAGGVALFWPLQQRMADALTKWLPDRTDPALPETAADAPAMAQVRAHHLGDSALKSPDAAAAAVSLELRHLGTLGLEVICQALCLPADLYRQPKPDPALLDARPEGQACHDVGQLYRQRVKGVYGDLLAFMGRLAAPLDEEYQRFWTNSRLAALQLVNAVKDAKHLQKNLGPRLREGDTPLRAAYVELRRNLFWQIVALREIAWTARETSEWTERLAALDGRVEAQDARQRERLFELMREGAIDGLEAGSLLNDQVYAARIYANLRQSLDNTREPGSLRRLRQRARDEAVA